MSFPVPENEGERLYALDHAAVLDAGSDPGFDRAVRLAARLFGAPVAAVSFLDETTQRIRAAVGLDLDELPRADSFCAYTICGAEPLVVADAAEDPRFTAFTLVAGAPAIRFYAGAPLCTAEGCAIGTLSVMDTAPQDWTEDDVRALADLAAQTSLAIQRRQALDAADAERDRRARLETERAAAADRDPLTGLRARQAFLGQGEAELRRARRYRRPVSVLMVDIDRFQRINQTFGHRVGDAVLKRLADVLESGLREHDAVARFAGDQFAVLLPETGAEAAEEVAERLRRAVAACEVAASDGMFRFSVSIGVTACRLAGEAFEEALDRAEMTLAQSRAAGRGASDGGAAPAAGASALPVAAAPRQEDTAA